MPIWLTTAVNKIPGFVLENFLLLTFYLRDSDLMLDALIKGTTLGLLLAISVGPIVFTVIKQSLNNGLKGGMAFILGIFSSDIFLVICCNFFTQFFKILSNYSTPLGIAGSALLFLAGVFFLFFKKVKIYKPEI